MADYYTQFCEVISNITEEEEKWATLRIEEMQYKWEVDPDSGWYFSWTYEDEPEEGRALYLYSEESGSPENVADFAQEFIKKFRPDMFFTLTWAETCSKSRPGSFSGGGIFVSADRKTWKNANDFVADEKSVWLLNKERAATRKSPPSPK